MKKVKQLVRLVCLSGFIILSFLLYAQDKGADQEKKANHKGPTQTVKTTDNDKPLKKDAAQPRQSTAKDTPKEEKEKDSNTRFLVTILVTLIVGLIGGEGIRAFIRYLRKKRIQIKSIKTAKGKYCSTLKEELGHIDLLGATDIKSKAVKLEDSFVSLCISESWRSEERYALQKELSERDIDRHLTPEQVMKRAFQNYRLLLVIGDPGSGKTTLLKYYAVSCLNKKYRQFGFKENVFPIYFPLRELDFGEDNEPTLLPRNLERWSRRHLLNISAEQFHDWLQNRKTLVLLDGLDEISSKEQRRKVCRWVKEMCNGLENARFVVTSRATGYRKLDRIEIEIPHLRADIMDFSPRQQEAFLEKWFRAVLLLELPPEGMSKRVWKQQQEKRADLRSTAIIAFLKKDDNKAVRELATVPMLLQIMAIIWKDREHLPKTRAALYDAALNYLLEYRDRQKDIDPLLPADEARRVLAPTALWMQEKLVKDEAPKEETHTFMQPILDTLEGQPKASVVCENLRDRAGLLADYDRNHYIFRHKSFREFLSGIQLVKDVYLEERIETLVEHFKEDWWEESLRFFISKSDEKIFDRFMHLFFRSEVSRQLDDNQQTLLQNLVREAPQKKIDALAECLNSDKLNNNQSRYVLDCLKTIGTPDALEAIENADKSNWEKANISYGTDIFVGAKPGEEISFADIKKEVEEEGAFLAPTFRNTFEDNVEYIKIPGGTYKFSVTERMETVPDLYFCKYPVTNKRYRRFISYLEGGERILEKMLPLKLFADKLLQYADPLTGYTDYPGKNSKEWRDTLRPRYDDNKKFNADDQPVVGVNWYAARAYCFWLSCLEAVINRKDDLEDVNRVSSIYRLPTEKEWEWAAGGEPDGSIREYPWPKDKGEPSPTLANFERNVGTTTPVGRYPEGATPQGLLDMAGNGWEWMGNYGDMDKNRPALRGGSWYVHSDYLRCASRSYLVPGGRYYHVGFRVVSVVSHSHTP